MVNQNILVADENFSQLNEYFSQREGKIFLLVHGKSMNKLRIGKFFDEVQNRYNVKIIHFTDYHPNPDYESIEKGIDIWNSEKCNEIVAVGGGSAIDVAKCIKLFANMNPNENYLTQNIPPSDIQFLAIPTTAGSGSEATQFAVVYYEGNKYSVDNESALPNAVFFDSYSLQNLPEYQKKSTLLDALCHAIESSWSLKATIESQIYASEAIKLIFANKDLFVKKSPDIQCCAYMLYAAHLAGKSINISRTTAGHAMSYKLTSLYNLAHGHAAALCVARIWPYMISLSQDDDNLAKIFKNIAYAMNCKTVEDASMKFRNIIIDWNLNKTLRLENDEHFNDEVVLLANSVNVQRLSNNPIKISEDDMKMLYRKILTGSF